MQTTDRGKEPQAAAPHKQTTHHLFGLPSIPQVFALGLVVFLPLCLVWAGVNFQVLGVHGRMVHLVLAMISLGAGWLILGFAYLDTDPRKAKILIAWALALASTVPFVQTWVLSFTTPLNEGAATWFVVNRALSHLLAALLLLLSLAGCYFGNRFKRFSPLLWLPVLLVLFTGGCWFLGRLLLRETAAPQFHELIPILLNPVVLALLGVYVGRVFSPRHWRFFSVGILLALVPDLMAQVHLWLYDGRVYGSHANLAIVLGTLADLLPLLGIVLDHVRETGRLVEESRRKKNALAGLEAQVEVHLAFQEDLKSRTNLLETTLSAIGEAIVTTDKAGRINFMNPAAERLTRWKLAEVCLCKLDQVLILKELEVGDEAHELKSRLHAGQMRIARKALLLDKHQTETPIEYTGSPILGKANLVLGSVFVFHDISEQREIARQLAEARDRALAASNSKSEFLASVSHEIRTPMNAILGMVDLLMETHLSAEQQKYVKTFKAASESLLALINDILEVSVMESGQIHLESTPFDLRELIEVQVSLFRIETDKKGLALSFHIDADVPDRLVGDPGRLGQILFNLVGNAIKFTHRGEIRIAVAKAAEACLLFSVYDTGIGISRCKQSKIFEIFTQADASTTREYGGTGLGLAICRNLVKQMGGTIWVESEVQVGSAFHFTLSFGGGNPAPKDLPGRDTEVLSEEMINDSRALTILVVEDSPDNLLLLNFYLKDTAYRLIAAENGKVAVDTYRRWGGCFDLILMDSQMPLMDGYTATREIRAMEEYFGWEPTVILALTASVLNESTHKSYDAGCNDHLKKPIKKETLLRTIYKYTRALTLRKGIDQERARDDAGAGELEMSEMLPGYLENRARDLNVLKRALKSEDFDTIKLLGHRMKGSGAGFGLTMISDLGAIMEQSAQDRDRAGLAAVLARMEAYLERIDDLRRGDPGK